MKKGIALTLLAIALTACGQDRNGDPTAPVPAAGSSIAYVTLSNLHPAKGDEIVVTVKAGAGANAEALGSFAATLSLGSGLEFVSESPLPEGMRAVRAEGGDVIAAGASAQGFADGRLFAVKARVLDPEALSQVSVSFREATGVSFGDQGKKLTVAKSLYSSSQR